MSSDADVDSKSGLKTVWGERAFRKPEEILRKSGPNSYTHVGWKSYIAQGTVTIEGYTARHYDLSTDGMQFSIREDLSATNSLPITVIVRKN